MSGENQPGVPSDKGIGGDLQVAVTRPRAACQTFVDNTVMHKSDESIRSIVTASIKRHSMHLETWKHTQLREQWSEAMQEWIARTIVLLPSELSIIGYLESETYGYLLTTQRLIVYENNVVRTLDLDNVKDFKVGNFKGYWGQSTETITLHCKDSRTEQFRYKTGYPSMGIIYGLMTVLKIRKSACR